MKVALYARVSTSDQNCAMQLAEMRAFCLARGWEPVEFVDHGWSGRRADRPEFMRLMKETFRYQAVLVWKLDRFGRSVADLVQNIQALESSGVRFIAISQCLDTDKSSPTSRLLFHLLAAIAEFEAEIIRERVKAGVDHAKKVGTKSGNPHGRPRKVFRRDEAIRLRSEGLSIRAIARRLDISVGLAANACSQNQSPEAQPGVGIPHISRPL